MNIFGLIRKTRKDKKTNSLDLRKTQSSPVIITTNTPSNLKPILTNVSTTTPMIKEVDDEDSHLSVSHSNNTKGDKENKEQLKIDKEQSEALAEKLRVIRADDMELLLSMETQARMDHLDEQRERQKALENSDNQHHHPKRLKFALPETPLRDPPSSSSSPSLHPESSPDNNTTIIHPATSICINKTNTHNDEDGYTPLAKRWSLPEDAIRQDMKKKSKLSTSLAPSKWTRYLLPSANRSDASSVYPSTISTTKSNHVPPSTVTSIDASRRAPLRYGCKVKWIGVELESAVGKTDGSVDGQRYFYTGPYRGSFLTKDELMIV
ncbi:uncharacterized protein BX664DRAFT_72887 [Halteromyces radiatus]|uniref:uncharacterized protein n=1 Tax=Halteromyces radiatus TaxID=101107 RepID=UPI00221FEA11|nr:uncharacterized protein BX664DRAFT_72887 [Halteromyces radiatus]KAI8097102.1 hypothetical protein BX664DRAFT_72887 [Halteromyces radiatus]